MLAQPTSPHVSEGRSAASGHFVQFYDSDGFLAQSVAEFVGSGLGAGECALVVATPDHAKAIEAGLSENGVRVDHLKKNSRLVTLDASQTLARFMVGGLPDAGLFQSSLGATVERMCCQGAGVRAFGEMVALLWEEGNHEAALQLERLWNELGQKHRFQLFCAYPMSAFADPAHGDLFRHVCDEHSHVIPAESYSVNATEGERLRIIAELQRKAQALQSEIERRLEVEEDLRRNKRELDAFVDTAAIGLHWVGPDGTILWANPAEMRMLGYEPHEYIGHNITEFHADKPVIEDILQRLSNDERLWNYEARLRCKDGSIKTVCIDSCVLWEEGRFVHTQCFTRDITAEREAQAAARKLNEELARAKAELEQRVYERTAELQAANREMEGFTYSISHDLRAPLRAIVSTSKILEEDFASRLPEEALPLLERQSSAANRLATLIDGLLRLSRLSRQALSTSMVDVTSLCGEVVEELQVPGHYAIQPCMFAHADPTLLKLLLQNLIGNAAKFRKQGSDPKVTVGREPDGTFFVKDEGIGFNMNYVDKIFLPFERLVLDEEYEGTGIGLANVKRIAERHGGQAWAHSKLGQGATFYFSLGSMHQ